MNKKFLLGFLFFISFINPAMAENKKTAIDWSLMLANSIMERHPEAWTMRDFKLLTKPEWGYPYALVLYSFQQLYLETGKEQYLEYAKIYVDQLIDQNGVISGYSITEFNIDAISPGRLLFLLHEKYRDKRYLIAMNSLRQQLDWQPRTKAGGFWHKNIYPWQIWLDGLYMGAPYYAQYAKIHKEPHTSFDDIAHQFLLIESKARDPKTGLLFHAWDESHLQLWADKKTGLSPHYWSRSMGWYAMALVDVLDYFPKNHPKQKELIAILNRLADALLRSQDESHLWFQVTDQKNRFGNYLESSASAMFAYAFAKAVNQGYLPEKYGVVAENTFNSLVKRSTQIDEQGLLHLLNTCGSAGLGGEPYRTGSFDYYISEAIRTNDPHGMGPFILAGIEISKLSAK